MKKNIFIVAIFSAILASASFTSCSSNGSNCTLSTEVDTLSYLQGMLIGSDIAPRLGFDPKMNKKEFLKGVKSGLSGDSTEYSFRLGERLGYDIVMSSDQNVNVIGVKTDKDLFLKAFVAAVNEDSLQFTKTDANEIAATIWDKLVAKKTEQEMARLANDPANKENLEKGNAWLAEKEKEEGVVKTESGLLYKVIKEGKGEKANINSNITMNYRGTLIDGTEFESRNNSKGNVAGFVPGFKEGLQLMNKGAKYELYIPAELGYGAFPQRDIPGNSVLVFEVELTDIQN